MAEEIDYYYSWNKINGTTRMTAFDLQLSRFSSVRSSTLRGSKKNLRGKKSEYAAFFVISIRFGTIQPSLPGSYL